MRGFTLLEILIGLFILILLSVIMVSVLIGVRDSRQLNKAIDEISSVLNEARALTLGSKDDSQFGVFFENSRAVLFKGAVYSEGAPDNKQVDLSNQVEIFNINFTGDTLVFERLTGDANPAGDVSIRLKKDVSKSKTIFINERGIIYVQ